MITIIFLWLSGLDMDQASPVSGPACLTPVIPLLVAAAMARLSRQDNNA
jgi:hypothetical protein